MITPDTPDRVYSTRLRTALVLTGSGTAARITPASCARCTRRASRSISLPAAGSARRRALCRGRRRRAALGSRRALEGGRRERFYGWRVPLRVAGWALAAAAAILAVPLVLLGLAVVLAIVGLLLTLVGLSGAATTVTSGYARWIEALFSPTALPTVIPRLALFALLVARRCSRGRRAREASARAVAAAVPTGNRRSRAAGSSLSDDRREPVRGGAVEPDSRRRADSDPAAASELARRYVELLSRTSGSRDSGELLVTVHDMDARRDLVFALLAARQRFARVSRCGAARRKPLAGDDCDRRRGGNSRHSISRASARDHVLDALAAALALPVATEPHLADVRAGGAVARRNAPGLRSSGRACCGCSRRSRPPGAEQVILVTRVPARRPRRTS